MTTTMSLRAVAATLLIGAGLGLVGCSSSAPPPPPPPPLPAGHYTNPNTPHGTETLDVNAQGGYIQAATVAGVHHSINGTTAPASDGLTFTESFGGACTGQPGTYVVTTDAGGVHFRLVTDPCASRAQDFPSGAWSRG
ncbi:hypothetical protein GCM10023200_11090 [Actinomycetospora chlora]|uniref:Lipoprotein n=1 Tax=Actinomycetospora chlora TaxID=663608 RepID=A0ABP9AH13_9PSEU